MTSRTHIFMKVHADLVVIMTNDRETKHVGTFAWSRNSMALLTDRPFCIVKDTKSLEDGLLYLAKEDLADIQEHILPGLGSLNCIDQYGLCREMADKILHGQNKTMVVDASDQPDVGSSTLDYHP